MIKRFTYVKNNSITQYQALPIQEIGKGKAFHCQGIVDKLNKLSDENEKLKKSKKGQELEIVRLHHLADAMSGVLRELGIYDVYNKEQINKVKKELKQPNCRNCIHFSCDNADIYCMEKGYDSIPDCSIAKDCDEYEGVYE